MVNIEQPKVFFVLVNYKGNTDTVECINSINSTITYSNYEIIVVDNSPSKEYIDQLSKMDLPNTLLVRSVENNGFAAGCNIGIREAKKYGYDYVILLNNDTIIKSNDLVEQLLKCFEIEELVGISGGKILYFDTPEKTWYEAGYISSIRLKARNRNGIRGIVETPFVTGCLQMISREAIEKVGLLKEDYFLCYEDADYCERMKGKNYKCMYNSEAQIFHKVSKSAPVSSAVSIYNSNRARFIYWSRFQKNNKVAYRTYLFELFIKRIVYKGDKKNAIKKVICVIKKQN